MVHMRYAVKKENRHRNAVSQSIARIIQRKSLNMHPKTGSNDMSAVNVKETNAVIARAKLANNIRSGRHLHEQWHGDYERE